MAVCALSKAKGMDIKMKRTDQEITGKNRILKELAANGRKRISREAGSGDAGNREEKQEGEEDGSADEGEAQSNAALEKPMERNHLDANQFQKEKKEKESGAGLVPIQTGQAQATAFAAPSFSFVRSQIAAQPSKDKKTDSSKRQSWNMVIDSGRENGKTRQKAGSVQDANDSQDAKTILETGKEDALRDLKAWLFKENIRMEALRKEIEEMQTELEKEKKKFTEYVQAKESSMEMDKKRLEQENRFFDQKMKILQGGFEQLEEDRRSLRREWDKFDQNKDNMFAHYETTEMLFRGVNSFLALKKRYKDLIKMFHPDNVAGDHEMVQLINQEYEALKKAYDIGMQA